MLTAKDIEMAYDEIHTRVHRTPVIRSEYFDQLCGRQVYFKAENFQKTGSFKARGAVYAVAKLQKANPQLKEVITHSSGNHGQALAFAAKQIGVGCTVVVPSDAPQVKIDAIKGYGAKVNLCVPTTAARTAACEQAAAATGGTTVYNSVDVMAGQGTVALELLEEVPDLDAILVPVGSGGMISGIAVWAKSVRPEIRVFGVEPQGKNIAASLAAGKPVSTNFETVADGLRVVLGSSLCYQVMSQLCEKEIVTVKNTEICAAMKLAYERLKLVIEPSSATGVAAVMQEEFQTKYPEIKKVGVILSGGNVDLLKLPWHPTEE